MSGYKYKKVVLTRNGKLHEEIVSASPKTGTDDWETIVVTRRYFNYRPYKYTVEYTKEELHKNYINRMLADTEYPATLQSCKKQDFENAFNEYVNEVAGRLNISIEGYVYDEMLEGGEV
ncbi:hypothetical protein QQ054_31950 [Oscillatoria amoena NRMC-F 0135]|nr:hypothetical protein [Oscillatoria amoena NRMC-F 0135]